MTSRAFARSLRGEPLRVLVVGAGAIGATVGGWLAAEKNEVRFYDRGAVAERLRARGLELYWQERPHERQRISVEVVSSLADAGEVDIAVLAVKTYSLAAVAEEVRRALGDEPVIVALQNGVRNQEILPQFFSKVLFGVVSYNAWVDEPGVVGYQKKGPLHLGALKPELQGELEVVCRYLSLGVPTHPTRRLRDATHCKLVINLANSLTTLVGHTVRPIDDPQLFQWLLTNLTYEGVRVVKAAGVREVRLGGMPSWKLMWAAARLPPFLTRRAFAKNVRKMVLSSMAQDVLGRQSSATELDDINGYLLSLAAKHGVAAPFNHAVYELCQREFAKADFQPLPLAEVAERARSALAAAPAAPVGV